MIASPSDTMFPRWWVKVPRHFVDLLIQGVLTKPCLAVHIYLASCANKATEECHPHVQTVAWQCGISERAVKRATRSLEAAGLIEKTMHAPKAKSAATYRLKRYKFTKIPVGLCQSALTVNAQIVILYAYASPNHGLTAGYFGNAISRNRRTEALEAAVESGWVRFVGDREGIQAVQIPESCPLRAVPDRSEDRVESAPKVTPLMHRKCPRPCTESGRLTAPKVAPRSGLQDQTGINQESLDQKVEVGLVSGEGPAVAAVGGDQIQKADQSEIAPSSQSRPAASPSASAAPTPTAAHRDNLRAPKETFSTFTANPNDLVREALTYYAPPTTEPAQIEAATASIVAMLSEAKRFDRGSWLKDLNRAAAKGTNFGGCVRPGSIEFQLSMIYGLVDLTETF